MRNICFVVAALFAVSPAATAQKLDVAIDVSAATAVLDAVGNTKLTEAEALRIAALPGNQGLIRKARSYGRPATDALLAQALVAAAHHDASYHDPSRFQFDEVRDHAGETRRAIEGLNDPQRHLIDAVKARIAAFAPVTLTGRVTGYLVAGGTSGGFAFGQPKFYLDLDRFRSPVLAATIMKHELFHAVQALARASHEPAPGSIACIAATPHGKEVATVLDPLSQEGTASYVGDVLSLPQQGGDAPTTQERIKFARNVGLVSRSITQLELSIHGLATDAAVSPDEVYALGFYGDEVLYALGYVMARAIAREQGDAAVGELRGLPGAVFVDRYVRLQGYGKSDDVPALKPETVRWAARLMACSAGARSARAR